MQQANQVFIVYVFIIFLHISLRFNGVNIISLNIVYELLLMFIFSVNHEQGYTCRGSRLTVIVITNSTLSIYRLEKFVSLIQQRFIVMFSAQFSLSELYMLIMKT